MENNQENVRLVGEKKMWPWWVALLALIVLLVLAYVVYEDLTTNEIEFVPVENAVENDQAQTNDSEPINVSDTEVTERDSNSIIFISLSALEATTNDESIVSLNNVSVTAVFADRTFVIEQNGLSIRAQLIPAIDNPETETIVIAGQRVNIEGLVVPIASIDYEPNETVPASVKLTNQTHLIQVASLTK